MKKCKALAPELEGNKEEDAEAFYPPRPTYRYIYEEKEKIWALVKSK